jgi:hypothetical protein
MMIHRVLVVAGALLCVAVAHADPPDDDVDAGAPEPVIDPGVVDGLAAFSATPDALTQLRARLMQPRTRPFTIVQLGDSHSEGGTFARVLRDRIAQGGTTSPGFVTPGIGTDVQVLLRGHWSTQSWLWPASQGPYGPRGVGFAARDAGATAVLVTSSPLAEGTRVTLVYAPDKSARGFEVRADGMLLAATPATPSSSSPSGYAELAFDWPRGKSQVTLALAGPHTGKAHARFFGFLVDVPAAAAAIDILGVSGTTIEHPLKKDDGAQLAWLHERAPDLVIVWFGSNSAVAEPFVASSYGERYRTLLARVHSAAPDAVVLGVGPPDLMKRPKDCATWGKKKRRRLRADERAELMRFVCAPTMTVVREKGKPAKYPASGIRTEAAWQHWLESCAPRPLPTIAPLTEVEKHAVLDGGGLFFDTLAFMGGEGSMHGYVCHEPQWGAFDHIHFTPDGQAVLAAAVWSAIAPVDVNAGKKRESATTAHDDAGTH